MTSFQKIELNELQLALQQFVRGMQVAPSVVHLFSQMIVLERIYLSEDVHFRDFQRHLAVELELLAKASIC